LQSALRPDVRKALRPRWQATPRSASTNCFHTNFESDWKSQVDHAARNETSLMMHLRPELVDLGQLPKSADEWPQGVGGDDPRKATADFGKECFEASVELVRKVFEEAGVLG